MSTQPKKWGAVNDFAVNPTHGSGWNIQARPTKNVADLLWEFHPRKWVDHSSTAYKERRRIALGIPPTEVGGLVLAPPTGMQGGCLDKPHSGQGWTWTIHSLPWEGFQEVCH